MNIDDMIAKVEATRAARDGRVQSLQRGLQLTSSVDETAANQLFDVMQGGTIDFSYAAPTNPSEAGVTISVSGKATSLPPGNSSYTVSAGDWFNLYLNPGNDIDLGFDFTAAD